MNKQVARTFIGAVFEWDVKRSVRRLPLIIVLAGLAVAMPSYAVVNPKLQPSHLAKGYVNVVLCSVTAIQAKDRTAELKVEGVSKGDFAAKTITLKIGNENLAEMILSLNKNQKIVAYVGKALARHENDILYYTGAGIWYLATMSGGAGTWEILSSANKGIDASSSEIMFGTFNGEVDSLWEMMQDTARGIAYFPAIPFDRFISNLIADFDKPIRGVAIYDVNSDGKLDIFACSDAGNHLFIQDDKGTFADQTEAFGLTNTTSASCSFADVNADGKVAILLDGVLYRQANGKFTATKDIPADGDCLSAAFVEINNDGYPDVVVSRKNKGLALYINPGEKGGKFEDKSETAGLTDEKNGAGLTGYFEACDWDLDGRTDLIYVAGPGHLLWQNASGAFESSLLDSQGAGFESGTAAFGTIVRPHMPSVYIVSGDRKLLIRDEGGTLANVMTAGNEIQDPVVGLQMAIAEDLNADGTVDLYAASKIRGSSAFYVANRNYASFLLPEKYKGGKIFPPATYNREAWGLAVGDTNGDGALDLLVGSLDGKLILLVNETLTDRPQTADVGTTIDLRKQIQTRIITVTPSARKGLSGCRLTLLDEKGNPVTHRWIGSNIGVGCSGPAQFVLAIRESGRYTLRLRSGDGTTREQPLVIDEKSPRHQTLRL